MYKVMRCWIFIVIACLFFVGTLPLMASTPVYNINQEKSIFQVLVKINQLKGKIVRATTRMGFKMGI